jgi:DNA-binding MarR family transcriptional regulator
MRTISRSGASPRPGRASGAAADARRLHGLLVGLMRRRSLRDPLAASCVELDLSAPQVHAILALGHDGALAMGDLARRLAVTEKTVTGLVDRLQRDGLAERARDDADRRVIHVALTRRGAALARQLDAEVLQSLTRLLGLLDAADRRDLFRIIEKLTESLEDT